MSAQKWPNGNESMEFHVQVRSGMSLIELLVAMAIMGILLATGYGMVTSQYRVYSVQDQITEMQQNARVAMNLLTRDLRMAGHGQPEHWPIPIGGENHQRTLTVDADKGGLTVIGCFGAPEGYLGKGAARGDTKVLLVNMDQASHFNTTDRGLVFIGEYDKAVIMNIQDRILTIDTNSFQDGNQGLRKRYPTTVLAADVLAPTNRIEVTSVDSIEVGDMLSIGDERLYVTGILGTHTIVFDTDWTTPVNDPVRDPPYPSGTLINPTPVFRVQALRYDLDSHGRLTREDLAVKQRVGLSENIETLAVAQTYRKAVKQVGEYSITLVTNAGIPDDDFRGKYRKRTFHSRISTRNRISGS
jgi:prepilin-type N-terminal cleavage/methylation domain-containing protein